MTNWDREYRAIPVVCPRCQLGKVYVHMKYARVGSMRVMVVRYLRCSRSKRCGWWKPVVD